MQVIKPTKKSDVVVTEDGAFFCDSFGFTKLLEEFDVREGV